MPETINHSETRLFADDTILFQKINNTKDSDLLQDLSALERWGKEWQMSFNPTKCIVIRVSPWKTKPILLTHYQLHGHTLEVVEASKYLGVTITNDWSWDIHIDNIAVKGNIILGFIRRNLRECTKQVRETSYLTIVRPTLEYAAMVCDPTTQTLIQTLENVQRRAARFVINDYTSRIPGCVTSMLTSLVWQTLERTTEEEKQTRYDV